MEALKFYLMMCLIMYFPNKKLAAPRLRCAVEIVLIRPFKTESASDQTAQRKNASDPTQARSTVSVHP